MKESFLGNESGFSVPCLGGKRACLVLKFCRIAERARPDRKRVRPFDIADFTFICQKYDDSMNKNSWQKSLPFEKSDVFVEKPIDNFGLWKSFL